MTQGGVYMCYEVTVCDRGNALCGGDVEARYTDAHPQARGVGGGMAMRRSRHLTTREVPERRRRDHSIIVCAMRPSPHYNEARRGPAHPPCHGVRASRVIPVDGKSAGEVYRIPRPANGTREGSGVVRGRERGPRQFSVHLALCIESYSPAEVKGLSPTTVQQLPV